MLNYTITKYEEQNGRLFICINSPNTYIEHFFHDDEMKDIPSAIAQLVAELEVKEAEFSPTIQITVVNKMDEIPKMVISPAKVEEAKTALVADNIKEEKLSNTI